MRNDAPIRETSGYHEEVAERRRYALLQAAATIYGHASQALMAVCDARTIRQAMIDSEAASVVTATRILNEIERREKV